MQEVYTRYNGGDNGADIYFPEIAFTEEGTYTYNITETKGDNEKITYDEKVKTEEKFLSDALAKIDGLEVVTEESDYGPYIVSIKGLEQGDNWYWNYYVNGEYAQVGISQQEVKDGDVYTFKLEKFE